MASESKILSSVHHIFDFYLLRIFIQLKLKFCCFLRLIQMIKRSQEDHAMEFATKKENRDKNCYPEVLPYDYNRVILKTLPHIPNSHYINASYVDVCVKLLQNFFRLFLIKRFQSFYQPKAYIVTQSCKTKQACIDFWRLVWEQNSNCVVMLTKVFDFMKVCYIKINLYLLG